MDWSKLYFLKALLIVLWNVSGPFLHQMASPSKQKLPSLLQRLFWNFLKGYRNTTTVLNTLSKNGKG
jgi:hypothetical protein